MPENGFFIKILEIKETKTNFLVGSETEGLDPGGGLVVEKLFPRKKKCSTACGWDPTTRSFGKSCFPLLTSLYQSLRSFNRVK